MTVRYPAARWFWFPLVLVLALASGVAAESPPPSAPPPASPEDVVREMFAVSRRADWAGYARLVHPRSLGEVKLVFGELITLDPSGQLGAALFGVATREAFDGQSAESFFEGLMKFMLRQPGVAEALQGLDGVIVGTLVEGDAVHVVYRMTTTLMEVEMKKLEVVTLERFGDHWRIVLPPQMAAIPQLIKKGMAERKAAGGEGG